MLAGAESTTDYTGLALVITALGTVLAAAALVITAFRTNRKIDAVDAKVDTLNESNAGELLAAGETRRVESVPRAKRTAKEQRHLDDAPEPDPPQGPGR